MKIAGTILCLLPLALGASSGRAHANDLSSVSRKGRCLLQVDGKTYISGICRYDMTVQDSTETHISTPGSFVVRGRGDNYAAFVDIDLRRPTTAEGGWNEEENAGHMQTPLGILKRRGACWVNKRARICLWRK